jgi:two-component system cell cycle response regulator
MNAQILLIGNSDFASTLTQRVRGLEALSVELVSSIREAETVMLSMPPDLVIAQAALFEPVSSYRCLRQHRSLLGVYFILVDDQAVVGLGDWDAALEHLIATVETLEVGIDAYLHLGKGVTEAQATLQDRLLQAQVRHGLQRAQAYRDLARTNDWLSAIALVDALTQLNNRRAFDIALPNQITKARSQQHPLSLMMLDIDFFKQINDNYGHLVGDEVLKGLSKRLQNNMRFYDTPYRYGGEEFVVILSNTDAIEARLVGQRLREVIAEQPFEVADGFSLSISVSIGIAYLIADDDPLGRSLLERADQNLLRAKVQGRNQVVMMKS